MFRRHPLAFFGILFIAFGSLFFAFQAGEAKRCTQEATATLVEYAEETSKDSDGHYSTSYFPIVSYKAGGKTITTQDNSGSGAQPYEIGEKIAIKYDPDNPESFLIVGDNSAVKAGLIGVVIGVALIIFELLMKLGIIKGWQVKDTHHSRRSRGRANSVSLFSVIGYAAKTIKENKKNGAAPFAEMEDYNENGFGEGISDEE